jgi:enoyl-CoA hydratase/carnithine racemase
VVLRAEAARIVLVNRAVPAAELADAARAWATELAGLPTVAVGHMKRNLNAGLRGSLAHVLFRARAAMFVAKRMGRNALVVG